MSRDEREPTLDEWGAEVHPAFGLIGASRGSYGPPGAVLFDRWPAMTGFPRPTCHVCNPQGAIRPRPLELWR